MSAAGRAGALRVCATPIGNLCDLTDRVRMALVAADLVACEDTRRTRPLLTHIGSRARTVSLHEHNEDERAGALVAEIAAGRSVCLVSDAGLPAVSDPGRALIEAVLEAGHAVEVLPGASAVTTALVASGLAADRFAFLGFLPRGARRLGEVLDEADGWSAPLVCFEAPGRLPRTLQALAARAPDRRIAICRELTKRFEEIRRGTAADLAVALPEPPKGEITLVLEPVPATAVPVEPAAVEEAIDALGRSGLSVRDSADLLARLTGAPRRALYERVLAAAADGRRPLPCNGVRAHLRHHADLLRQRRAAPRPRLHDDRRRRRHLHTRRCGRPTFSLTGTDEHGEKIARAAAAAGLGPKAWADRASVAFRELAEAVEAVPDFFIRTTDPDHEAFVQRFVERLRDAGDVYEGTYGGSTARAARSSTARRTPSTATSARSTGSSSSGSRSPTGSSASRPTRTASSPCTTSGRSSSCPRRG